MKRSRQELFKNIYFCWSSITVKKVTVIQRRLFVLVKNYTSWLVIQPAERKGLRVQNRKSAQGGFNILSFGAPENVQGGFIFAQILEIWLGFY